VSAVRLSQEQVAQFEEEGFVVVRGFIPADMLNELRQGYDAATRGELNVDVWKEKIGPERILQLGMPNKYIPGWEGHEYLQFIIAPADSCWAKTSITSTTSSSTNRRAIPWSCSGTRTRGMDGRARPTPGL
jgi:hypothetical protein